MVVVRHPAIRHCIPRNLYGPLRRIPAPSRYRLTYPSIHIIWSNIRGADSDWGGCWLNWSSLGTFGNR